VAGVVIREYKDGVLLREDAISQEVLEPIFGPMLQAVKKRRIRKAKTKVRNWPVAGSTCSPLADQRWGTYC